jgi:hypothetical protein
MNAAEKFAQDSFIAQMAATLLAGELSGATYRMALIGGKDEHEWRAADGARAVAQARAIYNAATDARIKGDTQ